MMFKLYLFIEILVFIIKKLFLFIKRSPSMKSEIREGGCEFFKFT